MSRAIRIVGVTLVAGAVLAPAAAEAQRGGVSPRQQAAPPARGNQRQDTSSVKRTPAGFVLDFQEQQLRTGLSALSEAAQLNVSLSNIQDQRITLRMGQPVTRDGMIEVLRQVSDQYGLKMTESGPLIRIEGTPARPAQQTPSLTQQLQQAAQA